MAKEVSYELGNVSFGNGNEAKTELSFWYESTDKDKDWSFANKKPVIVEFDIKIESKEPSTNNGTLSNEFPSSLLDETKTYIFKLTLPVIVCKYY
jgi:hypothetical protein